VGLFTESYDPVINGVSTSVKTLAAELAGLEHEPIVVAPRFAGFTDEAPGGGVPPVLRLFSLRTPLNPANPFVPPPLAGWTPGALRPGTAAARFDIVHTQQPFGLGMQGRNLARRLGVPLISTFHTLYSEYAHYFPLLPARVVRALVARHVARYYNGCAAVVVPSRAAGKALETTGVAAGLLRVVPTGVPPPPVILPAALEQARRTLDLPNDNSPLLLFVGRLAREKSLYLLIGAFADLVRNGAGRAATPPILLLVGSGPYQDECRRLVRAAGIEPQVRFAGFLTRAQLAPVYALATLFTFPSATETQGVVLSEAQSHGLPCVIVNGGGAPEFVRDTVDALVAPPGDRAAFAFAVASLLGDTEKRHAMRAAALASPLRPTPETMARQMVAVYESATAGRGRHGADDEKGAGGATA
jgi:glycosyltransferase involved in cell wall biosynthesis